MTVRMRANVGTELRGKTASVRKCSLVQLFWMAATGQSQRLGQEEETEDGCSAESTPGKVHV